MRQRHRGNETRAQVTKAADMVSGTKYCSHGRHYVPIEDSGVTVPTKGAPRWRCASCDAKVKK